MGAIRHALRYGPPPPPPVASYVLMETFDFLLLEDGSKMVLE